MANMSWNNEKLSWTDFWFTAVKSDQLLRFPTLFLARWWNQSPATHGRFKVANLEIQSSISWFDPPDSKPWFIFPTQEAFAGFPG